MVNLCSFDSCIKNFIIIIWYTRYRGVAIAKKKDYILIKNIVVGTYVIMTSQLVTMVMYFHNSIL